jgi:hypothetical protein
MGGSNFSKVQKILEKLRPFMAHQTFLLPVYLFNFIKTLPLTRLKTPGILPGF